MRRCVVLGLLVAAALPRHAAAQANQRVQFALGVDSVLAIRVGQSAAINVVTGFDCQGVSSYDLTIFYDAGRVQLLHADSVPGTSMPAPTVTTGTDSTRLVAAGTGFTGCGDLPFMRLTFAMSAGATTGSLVSIRMNHMIDGTSQDVTPVTTTGLLDVCQAVHTWGDIDDDGAVTSRDALVALTGAVGLPTTGFNLVTGDVDRDGIVTSRDALVILSAGVGVFDVSSRVAQGVAHACAPLTPAPSDLLFWMPSGLALVAAGDTVPVPITLPVPPDMSSSARLNGAGTRIAYTCFNGNRDVCVVDRNGSNLHALVFGATRQADPAWSPGGDKIAFARNNFASPFELWIADSSGANAHLVVGAPSPSVFQAGGWNPLGSKVLFTAPNPPCCGTNKLFQADTAPAGAVTLALDTQGTDADWLTFNARSPTWRQGPGADSVAFVYGAISPKLIAVAAAGSVGAPTRFIRLADADAPTWTTSGATPGIAASYTPPATPGETDIYLEVSGTGRILRLTRTGASNTASRPSFR